MREMGKNQNQFNDLIKEFFIRSLTVSIDLKSNDILKYEVKTPMILENGFKKKNELL